MFAPPADLAERNSREKPYLEWVRGEFYPKVSPFFAHGRLQAKMAALLLAWGEARGFVSTENDTNVTPEPDDTRRYLPDVGFWSLERLRAIGQVDAQVPDIPPDLAVEIKSPSDSRKYLAEKVRAYRAAGSVVALVVYPKRRTIAVHDERGTTTLKGDSKFEHAAFPGLSISLAALFSVLDLH